MDNLPWDRILVYYLTFNAKSLRSRHITTPNSIFWKIWSCDAAYDFGETHSSFCMVCFDADFFFKSGLLLSKLKYAWSTNLIKQALWTEKLFGISLMLVWSAK